ncbi:MAG: CRTAC1 family protein [Planctomycetes bacterium]|nr:CRTAC1 family protein [Planctomycetota bacterium]
MKRTPHHTLFLLIAFSGCEGGPQLFEDAAYERGMEFISYSGDHLWYLIGTLGSGVAAGDYDNDGDPDLFLLSGSAILEAYREEADEHADALWRNDGNGVFTDVTAQAGVGRTGWSNGAVFADYDGDGDLDLFVARHGPNLLWQNHGDGTFTEVAEQAGVADPRWAAAAAFADLDGDQDLDLYVTNYADFDIAVQKDKVKWFTDGLKQFPQYFQPAANILYRNNGDGTFTDLTAAAGVQGTGRSLAVIATDYDLDGDLDLFVANDIGFNDLFRNDGGMKFENVGFESGVCCDAEGNPQATMGAAIGDYDNDGDLDLMVTNYGGEYHTLYRNDGGGLFTDVTRAAGLVSQETLDTVGWGIGFYDLDLDGRLDILSVNGHVVGDMVLWYMRNLADLKSEKIRQMQEEAFNLGADQPKHLFLNQGDGTFADISRQAGWAIRRPRMSRGAAFADFDGDGRIDVAVSNKNEPAQILLNRMPSKGHWLRLDLRGRPPNVFAIGARVQVEAAGKVLVREVHAGTSYCSADDLILHAGLGEAAAADRVEVRWPDGAIEVFPHLEGDRFHRLTQGAGGAAAGGVAGK